MSVHAVCPDGTTAYLGPESTRYRNANGDCVELCGGGVTGLHTSNGYRFDLFATQGTFPAIHIKNGDTVCYADLISGQSDGTLNVSYNDAIYHANSNSGQLCPTTYTLSYSCGDGATGTPPESHEMGWGDMYTPPYDVGTCRKPGYSISGWKIDSTSLTKGQYYSYNYTTDKTMVAQWRANAYGAPYLCNYCPGSPFTNSDYVNVNYGGSFTSKSSLSCENPFNQTLLGYQVLDVYGDETGVQLTPGQTTTWSWPGNVQLRAMWSEPGVSTVTKYTLSYSCGDGATGTPPESKQIANGETYTPPHNAGTCRKPGYSISGWKIDSASLTKGQYYSYNYTTDKTMVAQWTANAYGAPYLCNYCPGSPFTNSDYVTANYGGSFTSKSSLSCENPFNQTLLGYQVLDVYGDEAGVQLTPGQSTTWSWPGNIQLRAMWSEPEVSTKYTLSYSCGDGATGIAPESKQIANGEMYTPPYDVGTCRKPGYSVSGWKIDSTSLSKGVYYTYNYTTDKTMVAQWTANAYGGAYLCNNGATNSSYVNATFGNSISPSGTVCTAADGATFAGYRVLDALGNDTGIVISPGASWTWTVPGNIRLVALWE